MYVSQSESGPNVRDLTIAWDVQSRSIKVLCPLDKDGGKGEGGVFLWTVGESFCNGVSNQVKKVLPLAYLGDWGLTVIIPKVKTNTWLTNAVEHWCDFSNKL